ncbi:MAG: hypothetical protein IKJ05_08500, partial [Oscillospiraceae bacterium]|nr:hypothetical protein [Oscillospiraceae bacterium]
MKNTVKSLFRIVAIFTVTMLLFAFVGCLGNNVNSPADEKTPVDTTGAYGAALSDYNRNGMKGMWISYIEFQSVDFS